MKFTMVFLLASIMASAQSPPAIANKRSAMFVR